jgi:hypothetical protein
LVGGLSSGRVTAWAPALRNDRGQPFELAVIDVPDCGFFWQTDTSIYASIMRPVAAAALLPQGGFGRAELKRRQGRGAAEKSN